MSTQGTLTQVAVDRRCSVHPARPAVDDCPVCGRPRCGADAARQSGAGCLACRGVADGTERIPASLRWQRLIAAALVALLIAHVGARIISQYVGSSGFAEITPFLVGLSCAAAAAAVGRTGGHGRDDLLVRAVGALAAVLATALAFRLVPGGQSPFTPADTVLPPYAAAVAGAVVSRLFR